MKSIHLQCFISYYLYHHCVGYRIPVINAAVWDGHSVCILDRRLTVR